MPDWTLYFWALTAILPIVFSAWVLSVIRNDVSIVDSIWSLMFLAMTLVYTGSVWLNGEPGVRALLLLALVSACRSTSPGATVARARIVATGRFAAGTNPASP